ncbi:CCA tRNA nucleotidyltransferase [Coprothermobacteraceae bacterium]|nr:CCA tRNA nucleotidyltransferase [Coprothermobacteraceae bacterium]
MDYLVGGTVRDLILGKQPLDYDIITDQLPELKPVAVLGKEEKTYRYLIGGLTVDISSKLNTDKRDFPLNAVAICSNGDVLDPRGGLEDLYHGVLRVERERIDEDPVRIFRAARLAAEFKLDIVGDAVSYQGLTNIDRQRLYQEYLKVILSPHWLYAVAMLRLFFRLPLVPWEEELPPLVQLRTAAVRAHHHPQLFGLPDSLVELCTKLERMDLSDPAAAVCEHGKKAVWAALVQGRADVVPIYKCYALFRHRAEKTFVGRPTKQAYVEQCIAFIKKCLS